MNLTRKAKKRITRASVDLDEQREENCYSRRLRSRLHTFAVPGKTGTYAFVQADHGAGCSILEVERGATAGSQTTTRGGLKKSITNVVMRRRKPSGDSKRRRCIGGGGGTPVNLAYSPNRPVKNLYGKHAYSAAKFLIA